MILYFGTDSFGNISLSNEIEENNQLIKHFGPMYIDFDEYPCYSGRISTIFEKMLMKTFNVIMVLLILQSKNNCAHRLMRKVGQ